MNIQTNTHTHAHLHTEKERGREKLCPCQFYRRKEIQSKAVLSYLFHLIFMFQIYDTYSYTCSYQDYNPDNVLLLNVHWFQIY